MHMIDTGKKPAGHATAKVSPEDSFLTKADLAQRWKCSQKKIGRLIEAKQLVAYKFGSQVRISLADALVYERVNRQS
jgi:excisionase family DNA binding protein